MGLWGAFWRGGQSRAEGWKCELELPCWAPLGALLGRLRCLLDHLGALLDRLGALLGSLLGRLGAIFKASWAALDAVKTFFLLWIGLGGQSWGSVGLAWTIFRTRWWHLGATLGLVAVMLDPSWPMLGSTWAILKPCGWPLGLSWAVGGCVDARSIEGQTSYNEGPPALRATWKGAHQVTTRAGPPSGPHIEQNDKMKHAA